MLGQMRDDRASRRRRQAWWNSLSPEEKDLEIRYQKTVDRQYFRTMPFFALAYLALIFIMGRHVSSRNQATVLGGMGLSFPIVLALPFLFIPTKSQWRARAKADRQDT